MASDRLLERIETILAAESSRGAKAGSIAEVIRDDGGYRWVGLYDVDHNAGMVMNIGWSGPNAPGFPTFPLTKGLTSRAIATKKTVNVGDVSSDASYLTALDSTRSEIIVPVLNGNGNVVGTIDVESARVNAFDALAQERLEELSQRFASFWSV
jgi:L-methionine (R)-S-oxide reductase